MVAAGSKLTLPTCTHWEPPSSADPSLSAPFEISRNQGIARYARLLEFQKSEHFQQSYKPTRAKKSRFPSKEHDDSSLRRGHAGEHVPVWYIYNCARVWGTRRYQEVGGTIDLRVFPSLPKLESRCVKTAQL